MFLRGQGGRAGESVRVGLGRKGKQKAADVLISYSNVPAVGDQVVDLLDSERVRLDRERELEDVLDRVLGHPLETRVVRWVDRLEVLQTHVPRAEELSVDGTDEVGVEQSTVLDGLGCGEYVKAKGVSTNAARAKRKESDVPSTTPTNLKKAKWSGLTALRRLNW